MHNKLIFLVVVCEIQMLNAVSKQLLAVVQVDKVRIVLLDDFEAFGVLLFSEVFTHVNLEFLGSGRAYINQVITVQLIDVFLKRLCCLLIQLWCVIIILLLFCRLSDVVF